MTPPFKPANDGLLTWIERWSPADAEVWASWRRSLPPAKRAELLLPLQAVLSGLVAFRKLENHPPMATSRDLRPHLHAVGACLVWATEVVEALQRIDDRALPILARTRDTREPDASLDALHRSLRDALHISERLLDLPIVDSGVFESSCDLFLRDLGRNAFFRPPEPLEFSNVEELMNAERLAVGLDASKRDASRAAHVVAFLALLRCHRFLGIADDQMGEADGIYRAHVVVAGVRCELRTLMRFLVVQGADVLADELALQLSLLDSQHVEESIPALDGERELALRAERMRNGIRDTRRTVKASAKRLRDLSRPASKEPAARESALVRKDLRQDIWAFRFILRGFVAKASAVSIREAGGLDSSELGFAGEFARHFRAFGPKLAKGTGYAHRGPLTTAVSTLSRREAIDAEALASASHECERFFNHLERTLEEVGSDVESFDRAEAAEALRGYLQSAKEHAPSERPPAGAFGGRHQLGG